MMICKVKYANEFEAPNEPLELEQTVLVGTNDFVDATQYLVDYYADTLIEILGIYFLSSSNVISIPEDIAEDLKDYGAEHYF